MVDICTGNNVGQQHLFSGRVSFVFVSSHGVQTGCKRGATDRSPFCLCRNHILSGSFPVARRSCRTTFMSHDAEPEARPLFPCRVSMMARKLHDIVDRLSFRVTVTPCHTSGGKSKLLRNVRSTLQSVLFHNSFTTILQQFYNSFKQQFQTTFYERLQS